MAGINAHKAAKKQEGLVLKRSEAYIGVLIDDLVGKGTREPYRMFTSRAEFRTLLRQDNADLRLTELSFNLGLASQERMDRVQKKQSEINEIKKLFNLIFLEPSEVNDWFATLHTAPIVEKQRAQKILLRPDVEILDMMNAINSINNALRVFDKESIEQAGVQIKYEVYIEKERELVQRMRQLEELEIPESFDYKKISSLGNEAREKLMKVKPRTLGQASRISGINPSDVQILMVYMGR
jgi:tRNA uridine 5-carboxymethylaminomethyl modification enzyme